MKNVSFAVYFFCFSVITGCAGAQAPETQLRLAVDQLLGSKLSPSAALSHIEWRELKLDALADRLDSTQTIFGRWALDKLLQPIIVRTDLEARQALLKTLVEDDALFDALSNELAIIAQTQKEFLTLFDRRDQLYIRAQEFYFDFPLMARLNASLNKSALSLEGSFISSIGSQLLSIVGMLCLDGAQREMMRWLLSDDDSTLNLVDGFKQGLKAPYMQHSFEQTDYFSAKRNSPTFTRWNAKDYFRVMISGSFGDRYQLLQDGFHSTPSLLGLPASLHDSILQNPSRVSSFIGALVPTIVLDVFWARKSISMIRNLRVHYVVVHRMRALLVAVNKCLRAIARIAKLLSKYRSTAEPVVPHLINCITNTHAPLHIVRGALSARTFNEAQGHLYSRGKVLQAYRLCKVHVRQVLPAVRDIAALDALVAVARSCREIKKSGLPFCYATFVSDEQTATAVLDISDGWLMIAGHENPVSNSMYFGNNYPRKIMLTGPNGCGKSCFLKMVGQAAVLAQSFGFVPATRYVGSYLQTIGTSICPEEDISTGLSSYMAQKESAERIRASVQECTDKMPGLFLIDEPYRGTVEAESAQRIITFCQDIEHNPYAVVALATHVQQPAKVLDPQSFGQHQADVVARVDGTFERTFKIIPGCADWWFGNAAQRSAFVDWISDVAAGQK